MSQYTGEEKNVALALVTNLYLVEAVLKGWPLELNAGPDWPPTINGIVAKIEQCNGAGEGRFSIPLVRWDLKHRVISNLRLAEGLQM